MREDERLSLTDKEANILRDICYARMKVMKEGMTENVSDLPLNTLLSEFAARQSLLVFLFWHYATDENEDGLRSMVALQRSMDALETCAEYNDKILRDYLVIMSERMLQGGYSEDDVLELEAKFQTFLLRCNPDPRHRTSEAMPAC